jgi:hypothetical protein
LCGNCEVESATAGLAVSAAGRVTTLDLSQVVGQIDPVGAWFYSLDGGQLTLVAGAADTDPGIDVSADERHGLFAQSTGTDSGASLIPQLGL